VAGPRACSLLVAPSRLLTFPLLLLSSLFQTYSTNGTILEDPEMGEVIQVQGDQRKNVYEFLTKCNICRKDEVKVHGF